MGLGNDSSVSGEEEVKLLWWDKWMIMMIPHYYPSLVQSPFLFYVLTPPLFHCFFYFLPFPIWGSHFISCASFFSRSSNIAWRWMCFTIGIAQNSFSHWSSKELKKLNCVRIGYWCKHLLFWKNYHNVYLRYAII